MGFSFAKVFRLMSRGVIKQRAEVAVPGQPLPARVHGCPVKRFSSPNRPSPSPAAPHPPATRVPPSPRSRGEGWGEGQLLHMRLTLLTLDRWPDFPTTEFHEP